MAPQSPDAGRGLAGRFGYDSAAELTGRAAPLLINATRIGMTGVPAEHDLSFAPELVAYAQVVVDAVAFPAKTSLIGRATDLGNLTISGAEIIALRAVAQFVL